MSVESEFADVAKLRQLLIPKRDLSADRIHRLFSSARETNGGWLVSCAHELNAPATNDEIIQAENNLGFALPSQYSQLLKISNGAKLFVVPKRTRGDKHVRYHLFNTTELVEVYHLCDRVFRGNLGSDPEFANVTNLNYLPFCDVSDDNYLAILLDGTELGMVFFLSYELLCRPYQSSESDYYLTVAESFEEWLALLRRTEGWAGRGELPGSL